LLVQEWFMKLSNIIDILAECGAATAALEMEHDTAEIILGALKETVHAGVETMLTLRIMDEAIEFFSSHFPHQERLLREHCDPEIEPHAAAHHELTTRFTTARAAVESGDAEAMLDAVDVLQDFHTHVDTWDEPAFERLLKQASENGSGTHNEEIQWVRLRNRRGLKRTANTPSFDVGFQCARRT
jgi:hemerythrin